MKSPFAPAINLMNQLNYRKKFALLGAISFMAIGVLIYSLFLGLNQVVEDSQQKIQGLDLIIPLSSIIQSMQKHRGLSAGWLGGNNEMLKRRVKQEKEVTQNIEDIDALLPPHLLDSTIWIKTKNNWKNIVSNGLNKSISVNFSEHTLILHQLQAFKVAIADEYALTFDPDIDSFYLIDTSINKLPEAMEHLAQIRAFGTSILAKNHASKYQRIEMITLISKLQESLKQLVVNLNKTANFNPVIRTQLAYARKDIIDSVQMTVDLVESDIIDESFNIQPDQFFKQLTSAIDASYREMYLVLLPTTKKLINVRLQNAKRVLYTSIIISMLLMLMVIYFVFGMYYSVKGSIQSLTHSLHQFADGHLKQRIELHTHDELNDIGNSFNQLAEKITHLLANVENSQKKTQQILDGLLTMAGILLPDGTLDFANATPLKLSGLTQQDVLQKKLWDCPWFSYDKSVQATIRNDCLAAAQGDAVSREIEFALINKKIWVDFTIHPVFDEKGNIKFLVAEARDATRRRIAEEHSKRTQKMEALGKLVGGIAHDYNNMLGVILGYAELLEMKCTSNDQDVDNYITEIIRAGERGKKLTQKMLAFSKPESNNPAQCNINQALLDLKDMLAKSLTASITLHYQLYEKSWPIWIDISELEDAILNMCINAKHAMQSVGTLTITTQNVYLNKEEAKLLGLTANDYLNLSITDTGCGMDEETKAHVFDPFFTTKGDVGNGLGLSQVFGFMERSGGAINLYTESGKGSQFSLYFPRFLSDNSKITQTTFDKSTAPQLTGDESILVVDDEPALRELANQILTHFGYRVYTASSGDSALNILATHPIDLMLSDIIMPNMDGYQLARQVEKLYPAIKIQLASGFSDNRHTDSDQHLRENMLSKPYSSQQLLTNIRLLLDGYLLPENKKNA